MERDLRPFLHEMRKMKLNLTCPLCSNLFSQPMRLPCTHIFCRKCITTNCPFCARSFLGEDLVHSDFTESMLTTFKNLEVSFAPIAEVAGIKFVASGKRTQSEEISVSGNDRVGNKVRSEEIPVSGNDRVGQNARSEEILVPGNDSVGKKARLVEVPVSGDNRVELSSTASPALGNNIIDIEDSEESVPLELSDKNVLAAEESVSKASQADQTNNTTLKESERLRVDAGALHSVTDTLIGEVAKQTQVDDMSCETTNRHQENSRYSKTRLDVKCAFCHVSRITEYTGPMLHYVNENPADGDVNHSDIKHFHLKCLEWAPQGYFEDMKAKNLEVELARASNIKCSKCGMKGAALGCYVERCVRSYHVPCAVDMPGCRWDQENFVMSCPSHSMHPLPCDPIFKIKWLTKSKRSKSIRKTNARWSLAHQADKSIIDGVRSEWTLCTSELSTPDTVLVDNFAKMAGVSVTDKWRENVSHVIASTKHGACSRTPQVLMAILHGKWILTIEWIKACLERGHNVPEEPYEINLDTSGISDGPRKGRIRATKKEPKLFDGLGFCFCDQFDCQSGFLEELVLAGGGTVMRKDELKKNPVSSPESVYIVYNEDSPQGCSAEDGKLIGLKRVDEIETLAVLDYRFKVVGHLWLLDTIAACDSEEYLERGIIRY